MTDTTTITPIHRTLEEIRARFEALDEEMNRPDAASATQRIIKLSREHGQLRRIMKPYESYRRVMASIAEAETILADPQADPDYKALAAEDLAQERERATELMDALQKTLVTSEDAAIQSVIMEIRAGTGGDEAGLFARDLYEMYLRYCERKGYQLEVLDSAPSDLGGFKE